jgi:hypothetical protein
LKLNFFFNFNYLRQWLFEQREQNDYENIVQDEQPGGFNWAGGQE